MSCHVFKEPDILIVDMADAEDGYDDTFDFDDADEPLDLSCLLPSLGIEADKTSPFKVEKFDAVTSAFPNAKLMHGDPLVTTGKMFPDALCDEDIDSSRGKQVLSMYFPKGQPPDVIVRSLQRVQNERIRLAFENISNKKTRGFHGTPIENIDSILKEGFKPGLGLLGNGVYVATNFRKANTYALSVLGPDGELQDKGNERAMFLCYLKLGTALPVGKAVLATDFRQDSINTVTRTDNGEPEFMAYDPQRVCPMYVLRYVQLRAVLITENERTMATLKAKLYNETRHLGMWSNRGHVTQCAVQFLMSIQDLPTRHEMYKVLLNFVLKPKLYLVINKVDTLIAAGRLQAVHKTALEQLPWQQYMCYTNILDLVKELAKKEGAVIQDFAGRYKFFELLKDLANVAALNAHCSPEQQRRLRIMFAKLLTLELMPRDVLVSYNKTSYIPDKLLPSLGLMELYCYTLQADYKRGLLKNARQL